ncbi:hypothetical protein [Demequina sediminicola]|uniref:hypothetical protein n=1 Tax=Demequina sediminicola TaxID=1095026 RepID=UPI00128D67BC|nr:hypothetical protein [Demequina sediminicola]
MTPQHGNADDDVRAKDAHVSDTTDELETTVDVADPAEDVTTTEDATTPTDASAGDRTRLPIASIVPPGPIPVTGDVEPLTGSMPVIKPIYPPKSRKPWVIATTALTLLLLGAAYMGWRMYEVNTEWQDYANQLTQANYDLGEQIAEEQATVMEKQSEIDLLSEQLSASNSRVLDLSAEKASAIDGQESASQAITTLEEALSFGQAATASLNSCIDGLEQLGVYRSAPEGEYEPAEINDYEDSVEQLCTSADSATARFQGALAE